MGNVFHKILFVSSIKQQIGQQFVNSPNVAK